MLNLPKSGRGQPMPDLGDFQLAFSLAQSTFAALSNHVSAQATVSAAAATYAPLVTPAITRKASGIFVVFGQVSISANSGSMVDGDQVLYQPLRGATTINPILATSASTATGGGAGRTVSALCNFMIIDSSGLAVGASTTYSLSIISADGGTAHTSGIVAATDGAIFALELPG